MKTIGIALLSLVSFLSLCVTVFAAPPLSAVKADVESLIQQSGAELVEVAFHDLATNEELFLNADERIHPASTIKLVLLAEVFHQAQQGKLALSDQIKITTTFPSSIDASPFTLSVEDDGEQTLYGRVGQEETVRELCRLMVVRSSNLATNLLMDKVGAASATTYMQEIGADELLLRNHMMDIKAFDSGKTNLANARGLCRLLTRMAQKKLVSASASEEMLQILRKQEFKEGLPAGVPAGIPVAHKTGFIDRIYHDAGIIYLPGRAPYVLVVMTKGIADPAKAHQLVAAISKRFYTAEAEQTPDK